MNGRRFFLLLLVMILLFPGRGLALRDTGVSSQRLNQLWREYIRDPGQAAALYPFTDCFRRSAAEHRLPESLLLAVARGESDFDAQARSSANAYGVMQILWPQTAQHLGIHSLAELTDPCTNIDAGARYLREMLERYQGNLHRALAAYNYGPARVPKTGGRIPGGAVWYSGYIHRHLQHILSAKQRRSGRLKLIVFQRPYRAAAFVASLQPTLKDIRLDWFRRQQGGFTVVMVFGSSEELRRGKRLLSRLGVSTKPGAGELR